MQPSILNEPLTGAGFTFLACLWSFPGWRIRFRLRLGSRLRFGSRGGRPWLHILWITPAPLVVRPGSWVWIRIWGCFLKRHRNKWWEPCEHTDWPGMRQLLYFPPSSCLCLQVSCLPGHPTPSVEWSPEEHTHKTIEQPVMLSAEEQINK